MTEPRHLSDEEIQRFYLSFGMALTKPDLAASLRRLTESRESLETLVATCPGLAQDRFALSVLAKPEMLLMLMKKETLRKVAKEHPSLIEAMNNLAAAVHEEVVAKGAAGQQQQAQQQMAMLTPFAYSLDDLDQVDDDVDDEEEGGDGMDVGGAAAGGPLQPGVVQRNRSFSAITPDQLAAAIVAAQGASGGGGAGGAAAAAGASSALGGLFQGMTGMAPRQQQVRSQQQQPQQAAITSDMFRAAMQQAMAATGNAGPSPMETSSQPSEEAGIQESLKTMREMGIANEDLARKALKVMGGDLQAAVDLVLSGWLGEDDSAN